MVEKYVKLRALEYLPELKTDPFSREAYQPPKRIPAYEIARIGYADGRNERLYVVGMSPSGTLYGSLDFDLAEDVRIVAVGGDNERAVEIGLIEIYETLLEHSILAALKPIRRF